MSIVHRLEVVIHVAAIVLLTLTGCIQSEGFGPDPVTDNDRQMDAALGGIGYRLQSLHDGDAIDSSASETLRELREHRDELRKRLDQVILLEKGEDDSSTLDLQSQLEDLSIRYETARLGEFETRSLFEEAVEVRFEDLDRELAFLEGDIIQSDLQDQFGQEIARLYRLRNDVALRIAEASASADLDFPRVKAELASVIGRLDIMIGHTTRQVDRAYQKLHPIESLSRLWL